MNDLPFFSLRSGASVALAMLALLALSACGADDAASLSNSTPAASQASQAAPLAPHAAALPLPSASMGNAANAFNTPAANRMNTADNTRGEPQDNAAVLSAQASLATDSQQVSPVLRYAPGDDSH